MNPSRAPEKGEVLKLGPPASGEVTIAVDPSATGAAFAAGTETLLPGARIPLHRHLHQDEVLFIHKGQGRATLDGNGINVVPGAMVVVPRQAWHSLRNTGTGTLQVVWTSAPPGMEAFFRELAALKDASDPSALQALAQRHGVEFSPEGEPAGQAGASRRHHRGRQGRGRPQPQPPQAARPEVPQVVSTPVPPQPQTAAPSPEGQPRRHRRHRGRGRRAGAPTAAAPAQPGRGAPTPPAVPPPQARPAAPRGPQRGGRGRGGRRPRVREVYMGGRWVQVQGEGPVIAPGRQQSGRRGSKQGGDDDPPAARLSVPL